MIRSIALAIAIMFVMAVPGMAAKDMPAKYKKCKMCHNMPDAGKGKVGPNLLTSTWSVEEWQKQVALGSKRDDHPGKQEKYKSKKMPKQKGISEAEVQEIYDYVQSFK